MSRSINPPKSTIPYFFIIESLEIEDEKCNRYDGKFLYDYLNMVGKKPIYYYIRSKRELEEISTIFCKTGYRYLYLSCHGDDNDVHTTFDPINFCDFANIFEQKLWHRRLFVSGCRLGNKKLATILFEKNDGMYSLTAPKSDVSFAQIFPFWVSFFYLMSTIDKETMSGSAIHLSLPICSKMFGVDVNHFFKDKQKNVVAKVFTSRDVFSEEQMAKILQLKRAGN